MNPQPSDRGAPGPSALRSYRLPITEELGIPHSDAIGITEELIRAVVVEFYRRARRDEYLGPIFAKHVRDWDAHLHRMTDFWSAALLRSGRYSGRPVEQHRTIAGLSDAHFVRWIELFEATVDDLCTPREADAFLQRARRMREAMTRSLGLTQDAAAHSKSSATCVSCI